VVSKLQRYRQYFDTYANDRKATWYVQAFPDGFAPRLVFVVHSPDRRRRVEQAVKACLDGTSFPEVRARLEPRAFEVIVLTFAEAAGRLLGYFPDRLASIAASRQPPAAAPAPSKPPIAAATAPSPPPTRFALAVDERELRLLRDSLQRVDEALSDAYEAIDLHQRAGHCRLDIDGLPRTDLDFLRKLILRDRPAPAQSPGRTVGP
jgi:hypothetical protein